MILALHHNDAVPGSTSQNLSLLVDAVGKVWHPRALPTATE